MEKPVAVESPGVRRVLEAAKQARAKDLKVRVDGSSIPGLRTARSMTISASIMNSPTARS
jgi:hypothetical protein